MNGADGVASDDVWAVGAYAATAANNYKTLVEHWNGSKWQVVASPNVGGSTSLNTLTSVDALSRTSAWAVGSYRTPPPPGTDSVRKTLIERWNGTSWSVVSSPNPAPFANSLLGVAATGQNDVWAVGWKISAQGLGSLILHYDGTAWTEAAVPTVGAGENVLTDISAVSANNIWASGYYDDGAQQKTLTLHYNGSSWSSVPSASGGDGVSILHDISTSSPSDAWAVGFEYRSSVKHYVASTQHWNGSAWSAVPSAISSRNVRESVMYSVAKEPGTPRVWAIGQPQDAEVICPSGSTAQASPTQTTITSTNSAAPAEAPIRTTESTTSDATPVSNTAVAPAAAPIQVTALDKAVDAGISETTVTRGAIIADFNNDSSPDIFLGRHNVAAARLYTNNGSGHFTEIDRGTFAKSDRHGCDAADVNSDGLKDIYCSTGAHKGATPKRNELWVQQPDHTFIDQAGKYGLLRPFSRGRLNTFINANGDSYPDLFLANEADRLDALPTPNQLFTNQGGTAFPSAPGYGLEREMDYRSPFIGNNPSVADLDKDGWQDLIVPTNSGLRVYHNNQGNGFIDVAASVGLGQNPADVTLADVNGDNWPDVIEVSSTELRVLLNTNGTFSSAFSTTLRDGASVAAGDVNGDDRPDIYVLRGTTGANSPDQVYLNNGSGTSFVHMSSIPSTSQGNAEFVTPIDYDGNGLTDFLVLNGQKTGGPVQLIAFFPASP
jgi:FG-GAP-like repeat